MAFSFSMTGENTFDVGAFDAKTYFAELLRKVQSGAKFNITKNGKKVAVLQGTQSATNQAAFDAHQRIIARSQKMQLQYKKTSAAKLIAKDLKELKNEGRKY